MQHKALFFVLFIFVVPITACDNLVVDEEKAEFDVYYYFTEGEPQYLGRVVGIKNCRNVVSVNANSRGKRRMPKDYVCCLVTEESNCAKRMD